LESLAERLVSYVSSLKFSDLPQNTIHQAKRRVIDALGCAYGGLSHSPERIVFDVVRGYSGRYEASLIGRRRVASPDLAAFYNGLLVRYLDYNDTYLSLEPCHPSDNLPVALAVAESFDRNGKDLLTALLAGYEIICRLCDAASLRSRGWDHVTYGTISASLISSKLMGLSVVQSVHALSSSVVPHIAMRQTRAGQLSMWKALAFANAGRNAVFSTLLARSGLTGPTELFEGRFGFFKQVSGPFRLNLSKPPRKILETSIKFFPAEYHGQSAIEAALKLRARLNCDVRGIKRIVIDTFEAAASIIGSEPEKWKPTSRETADHSLPYVVSAALLDGDIGHRQFTKRRIKDPVLRGLMRKIIVHEKPELTRSYPRAIPNQVTIKTGNDELTERVDYPRGHWKNPMSDVEVEEKFIRQASAVVSPDQAEEILEKVWSLEKVNSIKKLMGLLRARD